MKLPKFMDTKQDVDEFTGGVDIDLGRKLKKYNNKTVKEVLTERVFRQLDDTIEFQRPLLDKIVKWQNMYEGKRKPRSMPFEGCGNYAVPLTQWITETVLVRILDVIWSQKKLIAVRPAKENMRELSEKLEDAFDWWQKHIAGLRRKLTDVILQAVKFGTSHLKLEYTRQKRTVVRYASMAEQLNPMVKTYKDKNGNKLVKDVQTIYEGPQVIPISREDMVISPDSPEIKKSALVGNRFYLRPAEFNLRVDTGVYPISEEEREKVLARGDDLGPDEYDDAKKNRMQLENRETSAISDDPLECYEVWVYFDVDEDGEEDSIVLSVHPASKVILKAKYNHLHYGFRPYLDITPNPVEFRHDGNGLCKALEQTQLETDAIHNQRRDRMDFINGPIFLRRINSVEGKWNLYPGAVVDVQDIEDSVRELKISDAYPSTEREEDRLIQYGMNLAGVSAGVMGQQTAERPVARDTLALIQEANKKFKTQIENIRAAITEMAYMIIEMFAQYQPEFRYKSDKGGEVVEDVLNFPAQLIRDSFIVDLSASSEVLNTEVKREIDLVLYQMNSDYMTKLAGMAQLVTNPMVPMEMKSFVVQAAKIGAEQVRRIFRDYGEMDESLVLEMDKAMNVQNAVMQAEQEKQMMMQQQQAQQQGGQSPQGPPPQQMPPQ